MSKTKPKPKWEEEKKISDEMIDRVFGYGRLAEKVKGKFCYANQLDKQRKKLKSFISRTRNQALKQARQELLEKIEELDKWLWKQGTSKKELTIPDISKKIQDIKNLIK